MKGLKATQNNTEKLTLQLNMSFSHQKVPLKSSISMGREGTNNKQANKQRFWWNFLMRNS